MIKSQNNYFFQSKKILCSKNFPMPQRSCFIIIITIYHKDYPSSTLIAELLNEQRIIPIFAVEKKVREVYDQLSEIIRSAFVGEITSNLDILLELIRNQYTVRK